MGLWYFLGGSPENLAERRSNETVQGNILHLWDIVFDYSSSSLQLHLVFLRCTRYYSKRIMTTKPQIKRQMFSTLFIFAHTFSYALKELNHRPWDLAAEGTCVLCVSALFPDLSVS